MPTHHATTTWVSGLAFDSQVGGHTIRIDSRSETGNDTGPGPKTLLLTAISGCTGMDLASLLPKMRVAFTRLVVEAEAELTEEHPKVYKFIHLTYRIAGPNLSEAKVRKAITLSMDKYCGVTAMLKAHCPVTWELIIEG